MTDQQTSTETLEEQRLSGLRQVAHTVVDLADLQELQRICCTNLSPNGNGQKVRKVRKPTGADAVLAQYPDTGKLATSIIEENGGRIALGKLVAEFDARSAPPAKGRDKGEAIEILARWASRAYHRLEPPVKPSQATAETEVWFRKTFQAQYETLNLATPKQPRTTNSDLTKIKSS